MTQHISSLFQESECKEALDQIDSRQEAMVAQVIDWSHINSGSSNADGLALMEREIVKLFAALDAKIELIDLEPTEKVGDDGAIFLQQNARMIRISKRPSANRRVLMTGHYDTVFPVDSSFQTTRWLDDNTLNGPGVADMKGGVLVMLEALKAFEATPYAAALGWEICLSPDEETGSLASAPILMDRAKAAHFGLTYEPALADGTLAGARKGSGNYTLTVKGKAAHAGRDFYDGRNAVVALSKINIALAALSGAKEGLTVNVATLAGGKAPNVVPDLAMARFNIRLERTEDGVWFEKELAQILAKANEEDGIEASVHGGLNRPPKEITPANQLMMDLIKSCGEGLGLKIGYQATGGCCEGNNLAAAGLPNVDTLGVRGGLIHSDAEFVLVDSFAERAKLSAMILMAISTGCFDQAMDGLPA